MSLMLAAFLMSSLSLAWAADPDLLALYTFKEGKGTTVKDVSGVGDPLDLTVADLGAVSWIAGGGLSIDSKTLVASNGPATKIIDGCTATNEITIEAWVKPANDTQKGPARIVTLSANASNRNFTFGQDSTGYQIRLRTTVTGNNGVNPALPVPNAVATDGLSKLAYTRDASGTAKFYINGEEVANANIAGDFSNWNASYRFGLGHELNRDESLGRFWLGEYHLVAIHSRALTQDEIKMRMRMPVEPRGKLAVTWAEIKVFR